MYWDCYTIAHTDKGQIKVIPLPIGALFIYTNDTERTESYFHHFHSIYSRKKKHKLITNWCDDQRCLTLISFTIEVYSCRNQANIRNKNRNKSTWCGTWVPVTAQKDDIKFDNCLHWPYLQCCQHSDAAVYAMSHNFQ